MKKIKAIFCVLFGHSNIEKSCFGYISCSRCDTQLGDTIAGAYKNPLCVGVECACQQCELNWDKLTWKDKFLAPRPEWSGHAAEYRKQKKEL
jgi:hypothetical protein